MILLDHAEGTRLTAPSNQQRTPEGGTTVIILERDGSLRHYPPDQADTHSQARVELHEGQAEPGIINRILDFTFDILGISKLEVRVYEHSQR